MNSDGLSNLMAYDDLCARIHTDTRMPPGTRELALVLAWAILRDPSFPRSKGWSRIAELLGQDTGRRQWRHQTLLMEDAPRYEEPYEGMYPASCQGPRLRPYQPRRRLSGPATVVGVVQGVSPEVLRPKRDNTVCGADGRVSVAERDMLTGQVRARHWFCRRHADHAERVRAQVEAAGEPPPALPNRGGLLPCYFETDWGQVYRWATHGTWTPPYHGVCADEWPIPGVEVVPRRPRLALVVTSEVTGA